MTSSFQYFNIKSILRSQNFGADLLANTASRIIPYEALDPDTFSIEHMYRTSIPNKVTSCKIFDDDFQTLEILTTQDSFKYVSIDEV